MAIKIFITDDHYMIIEGIRSLLQNEKNIEWLGHTMTAESCLAFLKEHQPDVILLDVSLPDKSGIDLCRENLLTKFQAKNTASLVRMASESGVI